MSTAAERQRDSIERALIHHAVDYSPPETGGRPTWVIHTGVGTMNMTTREARCYVYGLADKERDLTRER
jgi:hypothetical protein